MRELQGSRSCVGVKLAYAEAVIALVRLYQRFTFNLAPGQVYSHHKHLYLSNHLLARVILPPFL